MRPIFKNYDNSFFKKVRLLIFAVFTVLIMSSMGWAAEYYVATNGNDGNPGTLASPWKTIGKANTALQAGDTVFIRQGTYNQSIKPSNSGKAGSFITYTNYQNETATITGVSDGADLRGKSYIFLDGIRITDVSNYWVTIKNDAGYNSTQIVIRNCYMKTAFGWAGIYGRYASYIKVLNNTLIGTCPCVDTPCDGGGPNDIMKFDACNYTLVQGNDISGGDHQSVSFVSDNGTSKYNVIADNKINNVWHTAMQLYGDVDYTLVEGNTITNAGEEATTNWCDNSNSRDWPREDHRSIQLASSYCIFRNNVFVNNGVMPFLNFQGFTVNNNRYYNNTSHLDYEGVYMYSGLGNIVKNSIFSQDRIYGIKGLTGNQIINNNAYQCDIIQNGATMSGNYAVDPQFVDENNGNFNLRSSSPMIDKGAWLTTITDTAGSGTSFTVADASYFMDGWGIIDGDNIQLKGMSTPVKIVGISGNKITIDQQVSWKNGDGVSLPYAGAGPDIGAYEYAVAMPANSNPTAVNDSASTTENQSVDIDVLSNDSDIDGDTLSISGITSPKNGTSAISGTKISYEPNINFYGTDTFSYTISDGKGGTGTATVTVAVEQIILPPPSGLKVSP